MKENWTVKQVSQLTGLTVRTLHHYDQIGLLKPAFVAENGYRYYNQENLARLQEILLFRELEFPLKDIQQLLDVTEINRQQVLRDHITLLELKRERLDRIINHARLLTEKGGEVMDFHAFDSSQLEAYQAEAKERWGILRPMPSLKKAMMPARTKYLPKRWRRFLKLLEKCRAWKLVILMCRLR